MSFAPETRRRDPLERTTLRLAGVFAIVIVLLLVSSSVLLYTSFTRDIHDVYDRAVHDEAREREMVADAISRLRVQVIATDAVVFIVVGAAGLWYARRTVKPIREALENQRRFIANASHELRTPLAIVKADLEVARRGPPDAAALSAAVDSSLEEVDRMSALVSDLLTLSRIDAREERLAQRLWICRRWSTPPSRSSRPTRGSAAWRSFAKAAATRCRQSPTPTPCSVPSSTWSGTPWTTRRPGSASRCA